MARGSKEERNHRPCRFLRFTRVAPVEPEANTQSRSLCPLGRPRAQSQRDARKWARRDSNPRRRKPADLQSAPIGHSGTRPGFHHPKRGRTAFQVEPERYAGCHVPATSFHLPHARKPAHWPQIRPSPFCRYRTYCESHSHSTVVSVTVVAIMMLMPLAPAIGIHDTPREIRHACC